MSIPFVKYHGLGNDYLVLCKADVTRTLTPQEIVRICDRNLGIGSDGIAWVEGAHPLGTSVRIFNPDGSEAENSGNGMRILARFLFDTGAVSNEPFTLLAGGVRQIRAQILHPQQAIRVEMGAASFISNEIPVLGPAREVLQESVEVLGKPLSYSCVSVGNPHCVVVTDSGTMGEMTLKEAATRFGPVLETHERFPRRINVQFARIIDRQNVQIEIWERGAGYTLASGSSSCAVAAVCRKLGLVDDEVRIHMPGGSLTIGVSPPYLVTLTGPVTRVGEGRIGEECFFR